MLFAGYGKLQKGKGVNFRFPFDAQAFYPVIHPLQRKTDVSAGHFEGDDGGVVGVLKTHAKGVAILLNAVGGEDFGLCGEDEEVLVVVGAVLGEGAEGDAFPLQALPAFNGEAGSPAIGTELQAKSLILKHNGLLRHS